jgi:hypothetical protein
LVVDAIREFMSDRSENVTYDKSVGSSGRRPDILLKCNGYNIIVECDEYGHSSEKYCACEDRRVCEIFQDLGKKNLAVVRFNVDSYIKRDGTNVRSPFSIHKSLGMTMVRDKPELEHRLNCLLDWVKYYLEHPPQKELSVEYLFYDEI